MIIVVEFPIELRDIAGHPTGTNRGWVPDDDPVLPQLLARAREVARTDDLAEAWRLVEEGRCAVARSKFDALAGLEIAGLDPARVCPGAWAHLMVCATCRAAYEARLEEILQSEV